MVGDGPSLMVGKTGGCRPRIESRYLTRYFQVETLPLVNVGAKVETGERFDSGQLYVKGGANCKFVLSFFASF